MFVIKNENKFIFSVYYSFSVIFLNIHYTSPSFAATSSNPTTPPVSHLILLIHICTT